MQSAAGSSIKSVDLLRFDDDDDDDDDEGDPPADDEDDDVSEDAVGRGASNAKVKLSPTVSKTSI